MHDRNGNPLKVGDRVALVATIEETSTSEDYCNVKVKVTEEGQDHGPRNVTSTIWVNAKQTELI